MNTRHRKQGAQPPHCRDVRRGRRCVAASRMGGSFTGGTAGLHTHAVEPSQDSSVHARRWPGASLYQGLGVAPGGQRVWASYLRMRGLRRRAWAVDGLPDHGADAVRRAAGLARQVQVVLIVHVQVQVERQPQPEPGVQLRAAAMRTSWQGPRKTQFGPWEDIHVVMHLKPSAVRSLRVIVQLNQVLLEHTSGFCAAGASSVTRTHALAGKQQHAGPFQPDSEQLQAVRGPSGAGSRDRSQRKSGS